MKEQNEHLQTSLKVSLLKSVQRLGWQRKGIENPESVADHAFMVAFMTMMFSYNKPDLDRDRMIRMALVHDAGEALIGDIIHESGAKIIGDLKIKNADERKAIHNIFGKLSEAEEYSELWEEWAAQKTPEAKFVKKVEKLEMAIQALEYEKQGYDKKSLDEFWENARKYISGSEFESLLDELEQQRPASI